MSFQASIILHSLTSSINEEVRCIIFIKYVHRVSRSNKLTLVRSYRLEEEKEIRYDLRTRLFAFVFSLHFVVECVMYRLIGLFLFGVFKDIHTHPYRKSVDTCDRFANAMDCYYFACIDSIYQCGSRNLLVQFSYHLCKTIRPSSSFAINRLDHFPKVKQH